MTADQPVVVYSKRDKKPTRRRMQKAYAEWKKRKENEESLVGKTLTLADFLK